MDKSLSVKPLQATSRDVATVQDTLQKHEQGLTPADLIVRTGLSVYQVQDALEALIKKHPCRLQVSEKGEITYEFDFLPEKNSISKFVGKLWDNTKKGVTNFVKWRVSNDLYKNYGSSWVNWVIALAPISPLIPLYYLGRWISPNFKARTNEIAQFFYEGENPPEKNIFRKEEIKKIAFDFIFGEKENIDVLDLEKRILSYIDLHKGKITTADLVMLTGWSFEKAEQEATKLMVQYQGNVYVTEEGIIIYHFPEVESQNKVWHNRNPHLSPYIWDNLVPLRKWNSNYASENAVMAQAITIQFLYTIIFVPLWAFLLNNAWLGITGFTFLYYCIGAIVSLAYSTFLPTFIIGKRKMLKENRERQAQNNYFSFLKSIFAGKDATLFYDENDKSNQERYQKALKEWQGEIKNDAQGNIIYHFERLEKELEVIERERKND
jgi:hypothetical protein